MIRRIDTMSARLREAIALRGIRKMLALAYELGVHESALSRWKKGGAMSLSHVISVCEVLDVSMDWLVLGRGHPEDHKRQAHSADDQQVLGALMPYANDAKIALTRFLTVVRADSLHDPQSSSSDLRKAQHV
ncbi:helix-turn-helix domain-containing protein [Caulobacter vibrioides]|uniref:helix-turn-helix domain-containing protein n=1 Tax=Caulobacter vibrioides TaxID=155892 RepID=UPI000BB45D2B|nr:helix-turn-helix transcriptional regulator [Caulobacter vibrioides]ATC23421.1 XRE family transcriptional regulator [Caulobacter vibrioides]PLR11305.1 XRE family transcriptional regulator [Caulobacter vibrioides]